MYSFNPHTHKKYDQPISGTDRLMYALIPVPMKGTIMIFLQMKSYPLIALIPVPAKGTMPGSFKRVFNYICFNPRTREGYDEIAGNDMDYISALIPVPMKGATSFITREIINDMF